MEGQTHLNLGKKRRKKYEPIVVSWGLTSMMYRLVSVWFHILATCPASFPDLQSTSCFISVLISCFISVQHYTARKKLLLWWY